MGCMVGYLRHSAPQASQALAQASQIAAVIGPRREQILAVVAQMSPQSSDRRLDVTCSFWPAAIMEAQCLEQAAQAFMQSEQALAQWAYVALVAFCPAPAIPMFPKPAKQIRANPPSSRKSCRRFIVLSFRHPLMECTCLSQYDTRLEGRLLREDITAPLQYNPL